MKIKLSDNYVLLFDLVACGDLEEYRNALVAYANAVVPEVDLGCLPEALDLGIKLFKLLTEHAETHVFVEFSNAMTPHSFDVIQAALHSAFSKDIVRS